MSFSATCEAVPHTKPDNINSTNFRSRTLAALVWDRHLGDLFCRQLFQQSPYLIQHIPRLRCLERKTKHSLGRELRTLLGVLRHHLHQAAGIDAGLASEADVDLVAFAIHLGYPGPLA